MKNVFTFLFLFLLVGLTLFLPKMPIPNKAKEIIILTDSITTINKDKDNQQGYLKNYFLTSIELNNICNQFQSSREEKANNETLQQLIKDRD